MAGKLTKAQRAWLASANQFGTISAGWNQGATANSCVRAGYATRGLNLGTGRREYSITEAGLAALKDQQP